MGGHPDLAGTSPNADLRPGSDGGSGPLPREAEEEGPTDFRAGWQADLAPAGKTAKARANLAALETLRAVQDAGRPATSAEQAVLARWAGWGALPEVFDPARQEWAWARSELAAYLDDAETAAAARSTVNAHYTSADVVTAVWSAVERLGFTGGRVLEPGVGSGNFLALRPDTVEASSVTGVELDPTTAAIASALYPGADIRAESFADSRLAEGSFDLVVGNVPFGDLILHDRVHNPSGHSIHNHFICKSLRLTRPGGIAALVTSRWTMDSRNPAARREIAGLADLLGAIRLPAGAFAAAAGTDVVCDILILRRREPDRPQPAETICLACQAGSCEQFHPGEDWSTIAPVEVERAGGDATVEVNGYFARHPHLVIGRLAATSSQYAEVDVTVTAGAEPLVEALDAAVGRIAATAGSAGLGWTPPPAHTNNTTDLFAGRRSELRHKDALVEDFHKEGSIIATATGGFARITAGRPEPFTPSPKSARAELRALVELRDAAAVTLAAQAANSDDDTYAFAQHRLNRAYDAYTTRFGPLNRYRLVRTGRVDPDSGEERWRRADPPMGGFRLDPDLHTVLALEIFDPDTQTARKAPIFSRRVVGPRPRTLGADNAADAVAACLDETGTVTAARVAELLGVEADTARAEMDGLVFDDPATATLVPAGRYLSGNVRTKLDQARAAAERDPHYQPNVDALQAAVPPDLGPEEIRVRLGVPWIDAEDIAAFARETFGSDRILVEHSPLTAMWSVTVPSWQRGSVAMTSEWGTRRADAVRILEQSLEQQPAKVYDYHDDGSPRTLNTEETLAAQEKQEAIETRFAEWVWEDPARRDRLVERYNRLFNSLVSATYDGSHLTLPGLAESFTPRQHQRDAVWRIISEPNVLLGHAVGAGKTATMVMAGMEMRRLGLVTKPAYVVPNHMLAQFTNELLQLYPQARVLVATKDATTPAARKHFVARCATGEWDAVVITHASFERIPVSRQAQADYIATQVAALRHAAAASEAGAALNVKRIEKQLARAEERHKRLLDTDKEDDGVTFEQTGIDYLFVDEAQAFKNLALNTRVRGVNTAGSQRASDLDLKLHTLRERHGERVTTFATATFITNSIGEMYVMQRYLQPSQLERAGLASFDAWVATFGRTVTALELAPEGGSYRMASRLARFVNVPELLTMFGQVADVRTTEQLALPTPAITGGKAETAVIAPSAELEAFVASLGERAERIRSRAVRPEEDNMLKVTTDGRRAALDLRLVDLPPDPDGGKIAVVADNITRIWTDTRTNRYLDTDNGEHPRPGALQLVFCDLGTPGPDWNVYHELRTQLVARGLPADQVRFIHEAGNDKAKADLFAACRDGRIAVLVGSSDKMGVGTNVQTRVVALHHVDCPWRPDILEQRDGRALRQGNQNDQVRILRYVTRRSFDTYSWQTVERKAVHNNQVLRGDITARDIDDIGDSALSAAEAKALASGNPLIMERAGVESDLTRLERLARAHEREQHDLANRKTFAETRAERLEHQASLVAVALQRRIDTRADRFSMTVGHPNGVHYTSRVDAGAALRTRLSDLLHQPGAQHGTTTHRLGELGGFRIDADITRAGDLPAYAEISVETLPTRPLALEGKDLAKADPAGLVTKIENRILRLDDTATELQANATQARSEAAGAAARIGRPFEHHHQLRDLRARLAQIDEALTPKDPPAASPAPDNTEAVHTTTTLAPTGRPVAAPGVPTSTATHSGPAPQSPASGGELSVHAQHSLYQRASEVLHEPPPSLQP